MAKSNSLKTSTDVKVPTRRSTRTPKTPQSVPAQKTAAEQAYRTPASLEPVQHSARAIKASQRASGNNTVDKQSYDIPQTPPLQQKATKRPQPTPSDFDNSNSNKGEDEVALTLPYSTPRGYPSNIFGLQSATQAFLRSFPDALEWHDVSGDGLLCGLRALSKSLELQHNLHASMEELHDFVISGALYQREYQIRQFSDGSTCNFSPAELVLILDLWCEKHNRTSIRLGWLTVQSSISISDQSPDMDVVWIYSSWDGGENDRTIYHYQGLGLTACVDYPYVAGKTTRGTKKRASPATSTIAVDRSTKKKRLEDDAESPVTGIRRSSAAPATKRGKKPRLGDKTSSYEVDPASFEDELSYLEDRSGSDGSHNELDYTDDETSDASKDDLDSETDSESLYDELNDAEDDDIDVEMPDFGDGDNGDNEDAVNLPMAETRVRDAEGFFRVGIQPLPSHTHDVRSGTQHVFEKRIQLALNKNQVAVDMRLPGNTKETVLKDQAEVVSYLRQTTTTTYDNEDYVKRYCDYTGQEIVWTAGPFSQSIEGVYAVIQPASRPLYHGGQNVAVVLDFINRLKRTHPILVLPTISAWLNARDEEEKQWAFNAANNCLCLVALFTRGKKRDLFATYTKWGPDRLEDMLTATRTGVLTIAQQTELAGHSLKALFRVTTRSCPGLPGIGMEMVRRNMDMIAARYSLTMNEFEELCFLDYPDGSQVFYPFFHLSRNLAREVGYNDNTLFGFADERLRRLRGRCNIRGEEAGLGEPEMDPLLFVYWMTHWMCRRIETIKDSNEHATVEEIAWLLVDRWGMPITPWSGGHIWGASVCKLDHGTAMRFGLIPCPEGEAFDPVNCFNFEECSITIDSFATNMGMYRYCRDYWPTMLAVLHTLPVQSPWWQPVDSVGMRGWWKGTTPRPGIWPRPPTPAFTMPLIDASWFMSSSDESILNEFHCDDCETHFDSPGQWIRHCRETHSDPPHEDPTGLHKSSPDQPDRDRAYWDTFTTCPICQKAFGDSSPELLRDHMKSHSSHKPHECDKCGRRFRTKQNLRYHLDGHNEHNAFKCEKCGKLCKHERSLIEHMKLHAPPESHVCEECGKQYRKKSALSKHRKKKHMPQAPDDKPLTKCEKCGETFREKYSLPRHMKRMHKAFACVVCKKTFDSEAEVTQHCQKEHVPKVFSKEAVFCEECFVEFQHRKSLVQHVKRHLLKRMEEEEKGN